MIELGFFLILWLVGSVVVGIAAAARGRLGVGWFVLAMLLSPLIAGFMLILFPALADHRGKRECPACAEWISPDAKVCIHCGSQVTPIETFGGHMMVLLTSWSLTNWINYGVRIAILIVVLVWLAQLGHP